MLAVDSTPLLQNDVYSSVNLLNYRQPLLIFSLIFPSAYRTGGRHQKTPPGALVAMKWARPLLQHAVCSERIPFVTHPGISAALSIFFVPGDLGL